MIIYGYCYFFCQCVIVFVAFVWFINDISRVSFSYFLIFMLANSFSWFPEAVAIFISLVSSCINVFSVLSSVATAVVALSSALDAATTWSVPSLLGLTSSPILSVVACQGLRPRHTTLSAGIISWLLTILDITQFYSFRSQLKYKITICSIQIYIKYI